MAPWLPAAVRSRPALLLHLLLTLAACAGCGDWSVEEALRGEVRLVGSAGGPAPAGRDPATLPRGAAGGRRRVWLVGVDGLSARDLADRMDDHPYATLRRMLREGSATLEARADGGPARCGPEARFDSAPGWSNVLFGRDCRDHHVTRNGDVVWLRAHADAWPSLLRRARGELGLRTGAVAAHPILSDVDAERARGLPPSGLLAIEGAGEDGGGWRNLDYHAYTQGDDSLAVRGSIEAIVDWDVDLLLTHFDGVDHIGHMRGYGSAGWARRVERTDARIARVLAAIAGERTDGTRDPARARAFAHEDWLILLTSDHGGHPTPGCREWRCCVPGFGRCGSHDVRLGADDRIPFLVWTMGGRATPLRPLEPPVRQLDVWPTVLAWLGAETSGAPGREQAVTRPAH